MSENIKMYDWDLRKKVPMVPKGTKESKRSDPLIIINNVVGIGKACSIKLMSTYGEIPEEALIKGSNETTSDAWDNIDKNLLECILEAKNAVYKINPVVK